MKKITLLFLAAHLLAGMAFSQEHMVAGWTFPSDGLAADTGVSANLTQEIITVGGTAAIELKNGFTTKAAQASGWNDGMDQKGWVVTLSTEGFMNLTVSSRQQSGGNDPGPKFFKLQYSQDGGGSWTDLLGGDITVENDWETSFVDQLALPEACDDLEQLMLRWLMASNEASGAGGNVLEDGKSKIDEIFVRGDLINSVEEAATPGIQLQPSTGGGKVAIRAPEMISTVYVHSVTGKLLLKETVHAAGVVIDLGGMDGNRLLLITVHFQDPRKISTLKYFMPSR
jgi:hypothetical protein